MLGLKSNKNKGSVGALLSSIPQEEYLWNHKDQDGRNSLACIFHQRYDLVQILQEIPSKLFNQEWFWTNSINPKTLENPLHLVYKYLFGIKPVDVLEPLLKILPTSIFIKFVEHILLFFFFNNYFLKNITKVIVDLRFLFVFFYI
ncbi:hypothetical protein RFI_28711 [Reticulomyxa filosa]|uniref:Uncharacterized protein n=1 Tax=Reticulomyxa filosa TaxID=46433 RepID=X6M6M4_RETFI|nr:hypothetical protein RFI_28711 [Reticulomyxa filosa]|eukprot:ETO08675.1 hypothetical protein RFI_28711 [Reticulomyxa filosa]